MIISLIAAMGENRAIGFKGQIPWRLPADSRHFKDITMGHPVIMGSKTFESMPKALPGRTNIILTKDMNYSVAAGALGSETVLIAHSLDEAIALAKAAEGADEIFVAGGGQIYSLALPLADRLYLTEVRGTFEGDAFFPVFNENEWELTASEEHQKDEKNPFDFTYLTYQRKK